MSKRPPISITINTGQGWPAIQVLFPVVVVAFGLLGASVAFAITGWSDWSHASRRPGMWSGFPGSRWQGQV